MQKHGQIDYIYSEDSDILAYGCVNIVKSLKKKETVRVLNQGIIDSFRKKFQKGKLNSSAKNKRADYFFELSQDDRLKVCIFSGCDYVDNIKGLGFSTLMNFFDDTYSEENYIKNFVKQQALKTGEKKSDLLPEGTDTFKEYFRLVKLSFLSFKHQIIYDKKKLKFGHLNHKEFKRLDVSDYEFDDYKVEDFVGAFSLLK